MNIKAAIFDLNGTVLADEYVYGAAFREVLRKLGKHTTAKYPHIGGIGVAENWPRLLDKYKIKTNKTVEELASMTQKAYLARLGEVQLKEGFENFVENLIENEVHIGLATSNDWWMVDKVFDELGIADVFESVTTGEEVLNKKPSPDIFLVAAEKLGVAPEHCIVFEDSQAGVEAAHLAGMKVVGIARDAKHADSLSEADIVFKNGYPDLEDFEVE